MNELLKDFNWKADETVTNVITKESKTVTPAGVKFGYDKLKSKIEKEGFRIYEVVDNEGYIELLTEFQVKRWKTGGKEHIYEILNIYKSIFICENNKMLDKEFIITKLQEKYKIDTIEYFINRLIDEKCVTFDKSSNEISNILD